MFYEKKTKRAWFTSTSSEVCWEQWAITIDVVTNIHEKGKQGKEGLMSVITLCLQVVTNQDTQNMDVR